MTIESGDLGGPTYPDPDLAAGHRLVFVGGLHRSGTTPFARCLAMHPAVSGFANTGVKEDEGQHLQTLYPAANEFGGAGRFARSPAAHLTESSSLATPENAQRLLAQWQRYWDTDKPIWLEKSPPNLVRMRFLQELFPAASFIMLIRHPAIVTMSTKKWAPRSTTAGLLANWFAAHRQLEQDAPRVRRLLVVRYEDLVDAPGKTFQRVSGFLDLDGEIPLGSWRSDRSRQYEERWQQLLTSSLPQHWPVRRLAKRYEQPARRYGYSLQHLAYRGPSLLEPASGQV